MNPDRAQKALSMKPGLHSYGFMDKAFWSLLGFILSQLVLMALAMLPRQFWRGKAARTAGDEAQAAKA